MDKIDIGVILGTIEGETKGINLRLTDLIQSNNAQHTTIFEKINNLTIKMSTVENNLTKTISDVNHLRVLAGKDMTEKFLEVIKNKFFLLIVLTLIILCGGSSVGINKIIEIISKFI